MKLLLVEFEKHHEKTSSIIIDSILTTDDLELKVQVIERWIDIMESALNENNFMLLFEISCTLSKPPISKLKAIWKKEEEAAHIHGWDFSHIRGRYEEEADLPWNYREVVRRYLDGDMNILDYDTGGGEFLLSLKHPFHRTAATEVYLPNVELCRKTLLPFGVDFRPCDNPADIPFEDESFDMIINRHGDFNA